MFQANAEIADRLVKMKVNRIRDLLSNQNGHVQIIHYSSSVL